MKNILVTTELFTLGGLETHVKGEIYQLSKLGCKVHLAVGAQYSDELVPDQVLSVTSGLEMGPRSSISDLVGSVEKLRALIREEKIECVHAHPFTSLIPSFIAAELERVPFALTLHGPASVGGHYGPIYDFLFRSIILPNSGLAAVVSEEVAELVQPYVSENAICVIRNAVDIDALGGRCSSKCDPRWLIVGRLDEFKAPGIADLVRKAKSIGVPGVVIIGSGSAQQDLARTIDLEGLGSFVEFLGARPDVTELMPTFAAVAGMGRVVLEAVACGKPVILTGYDGVKGLLDERLFLRAKDANFSGRNLHTVDAETLSEQIKVLHKGWAERDLMLLSDEFSESAAWTKFLNRLDFALQSPSTVLSQAYVTFLRKPVREEIPFLQSPTLLAHIAEALYGVRNFSTQLESSFRYYEGKFIEQQVAMSTQEREQQAIQFLNTISDRDKQITALNQLLGELNSRVTVLGQAVADRDGQVSALTQAVADSDGKVSALSQAVADRDGQFSALRHEIAERDTQVSALSQAVADRDNQIAGLSQTLSVRDGQVRALNEAVTQRDSQIADLSVAVGERDRQITGLDEAVIELEERLSTVLLSNSWRITKPARFVFRTVRHGMGEQDKLQVRLLLRNQYRRLPLPFKAKNALRTAFFRLTGWSSHAPLARPQAQPAASLARAIHISPPIQTRTGEGIQGSTLAVSSEPVRQIMPYFGVRRPHGKRRAAILTNQLLDWHDGRPRFGGGERYALELARLLRELSIDVTFFQPSLRSGSGDYYSFEVKLLTPGDSVGEFHYGACSTFTELTQDYDHVYYHLPEYASGIVREDGVMTCHGIWFDHNNYPGSIFRTPPWFEQLYRAFRNPLGVVSVDTNSIGVIRSLWPEMAQKMRFIPNFYDAKSYYPDPVKRDPQRLTILFPRRSQINRGSRIFGDILDRIPYDVDIVWLGEGDPVDTQIVKDVCARDNRASFHVADFDQMPAWYQKADIAVIPTLACEGTSLSCIEALACGCAVIATNVGGLPDVVYDGINGLLVDPEASSLANAINRLIEDQALRERLQRSGAETASNFELQMWRARWVEVLRGYGWISDDMCGAWFTRNHSGTLVTHPTKAENWVILTRNAIHGGVESLIREEARLLNAPVIVCGGHDFKDTCPFEYSRADDAGALERAIADYDVILYHWLPDWALKVIRKSNKSSIEFVHRTDTSESDKTVPTALVTHSAFLAKFVHEVYGKSCRVVDHPIALDRFVPQSTVGTCIGAITSYYGTKGIDIFLRAWALLKHEFPQVPVRFYGAGDDLYRFKKLAAELGVDAEFRDATREPWKAMQDFRCFVVPSRIEGLPVAILEALAMNIPVVASALPGMQEFNDLAVRRGYEAYVNLACPEEPEDLARVIRAVLNNGERKDSSRYIRDYYSPQKHCSDLVSVLREISRH